MSHTPVPVGEPPDAGIGTRSFGVEVACFFPQPVQASFRVFVHRINEWWDQLLHPEARVVLDPSPGGQFLQTWSSGGAHLAVVTYVETPYRLRLSGPLAMARPVINLVDLTFEPTTEDGTRLTVRHDAIGDVDEAVRETYERSWQDLVDRAFRTRLDAG